MIIKLITYIATYILDLAKSDPDPFPDPNPKEKYGYG
jgi:hypothetical protein